MNRTAPANHWNPTQWAALGLLTWIAIWYWGTLRAMAEIWLRSDTYTHGFIVPPIALWLIWRKRQQLADWHPSVTWWLLPLLALLVFGWLLGELTAVNALTQFAITAIIVASLIVLLGIKVSKHLAFPLIFLFFAVPIGDFMMPTLMEWTANFTVIALRATGIPVYREGLQFVIPSGNWSVVEACSGIRYLIASLTVGTLFAYLNYSSFKRRLIFIGVSLAVPIIANWLRAYLIVLLGHLSGNKLAAGADHLIYGWVFFGIVIGVMFAIGMRWSEAERIPEAEALDSRTGAPLRTTSPWLPALAIAMVTAAGPLAHALLSQSAAKGPVVLAWSNAGPSPWQTTPLPPGSWKPAFANASAELHQRLSDGRGAVELYIAYYRQQNFERKLITSTNLLVPYKDDEWLSANQTSRELALPDGPLDTRQADVVKKNADAQRLRVHYWYWINGRATTSDLRGKLYTALSVLLGQGDDSALIAVYAPSESSERIPEFLASHRSTIEAMLRQASQAAP